MLEPGGNETLMPDARTAEPVTAGGQAVVSLIEDGEAFQLGNRHSATDGRTARA
jgi:hypothetical protein